MEVVGKGLGVMVDGGDHLSIHNNAVHLKKQGQKEPSRGGRGEPKTDFKKETLNETALRSGSSTTYL